MAVMCCPFAAVCAVPTAALAHADGAVAKDRCYFGEQQTAPQLALDGLISAAVVALEDQAAAGAGFAAVICWVVAAAWIAAYFVVVCPAAAAAAVAAVCLAVLHAAVFHVAVAALLSVDCQLAAVCAAASARILFLVWMLAADSVVA